MSDELGLGGQGRYVPYCTLTQSAVDSRSGHRKFCRISKNQYSMFIKNPDKLAVRRLTVVSILDVMIKLGETLFQSREVRGAVCSGDFELDSKARGVSFCGGGGFSADRVIELP